MVHFITGFISMDLQLKQRKLFENHFLQEGGKFNFWLEIRNLKEEVNDENVESGVCDDVDE